MPISTDRDRVRLMIGDTESADPLLSDDEIDVFVDYRQIENEDEVWVTNIPAAAADAAGAIAAKYARSFNFAEDGQRFDLSQRVGHYIALEETLRRRAGGTAMPAGATT